ncbi:PIR Superfamily Protein [Plasmodium ovale wallikeri]|uniref:PIR Superfamily Protein n=1 Tax=Plasmodium ovale wallikeri TaxID=864142 RepID=A0A1A9AG28_PLAOA|nr:PIR Superfamily Protein [Plasmodium ovale wallikeri]SBT56277.1 PIR Superfamily Protein [Plasmodium ovale wallikeri]
MTNDGESECTNNKPYICFSKYVEYAGDIDEKSILPTLKNNCNFSSNDKICSQIPSSDKICVQFKYIYQSLSNTPEDSGPKPPSLEEDDFVFLNYWLNNKLKGHNNFPSVTVADFFNELKSKNKDFFTAVSFENKFSDIDPGKLENMRTLYELYNFKTKIHNTIIGDNEKSKGGLLLQYMNECKKKYVDAIINCSNDCTCFFNSLKDFKEKHKSKLTSFSDSLSKYKFNESFELPDYDIVLQEHRNSIAENFKFIVKAPLLPPIFVLLFIFIFFYKCTTFGQFVRSKIKRIKNMFTNADDTENEIMSHYSDYDSNILDQEEYNISYSVKDF